MYYNVHCMHVWMYISDKKLFFADVPKLFWTLLDCPTTALQAAPERDGPGILICSCVTCRKILDLKK